MRTFYLPGSSRNQPARAAEKSNSFYSLWTKRLADLSLSRAVLFLSSALLLTRTWISFLPMNGVLLKRSLSKRLSPDSTPMFGSSIERTTKYLNYSMTNQLEQLIRKTRPQSPRGYGQRWSNVPALQTVGAPEIWLSHFGVVFYVLFK